MMMPIIPQVWTIDRNALPSVQNYVHDLYDFWSVPEENTVTDLIGAGTATARSQFYGWVVMMI
jgi:hypothetical protein